MKEIQLLLEQYEWPCLNSITFGDGKMVLLEILFKPKESYSIQAQTITTIQDFLHDHPDDLTTFDVFAKTTYKQFRVHAGDGSYEGDGVIYVLNKKDDSLLWFAFFEKSERFKKVKVDELGYIRAVAENNVTWKIPIDNPLEIELILPDVDV